uniref:(California timema) hypothetical protein n=1 Tax=Timema californicum TaxID=61474 RepID=A0A7R9P710_TIMCA|nr:unnamed protein product [Timema californicum]
MKVTDHVRIKARLFEQYLFFSSVTIDYEEVIDHHVKHNASVDSHGRGRRVEACRGSFFRGNDYLNKGNFLKKGVHVCKIDDYCVANPGSPCVEMLREQSPFDQFLHDRFLVRVLFVRTPARAQEINQSQRRAPQQSRTGTAHHAPLIIFVNSDKVRCEVYRLGALYRGMDLPCRGGDRHVNEVYGKGEWKAILKKTEYTRPRFESRTARYRQFSQLRESRIIPRGHRSGSLVVAWTKKSTSVAIPQFMKKIQFLLYGTVRFTVPVTWGLTVVRMRT